MTNVIVNQYSQPSLLLFTCICRANSLHFYSIFLFEPSFHSCRKSFSHISL